MAAEVQNLKTTLEVDVKADKAKAALDDVATKLDKDIQKAAERQAKEIDKLNSTIEQNARKSLEARRQLVSGVATVFGGLQAALGDADDGLSKFIGKGTSIVLMANQWGQLTNSILQSGQAIKDIVRAQAAVKASQIALAGKGGGGTAGTASSGVTEGVTGGLIATAAGKLSSVGAVVGKAGAAVGSVLASTIGAVVTAGVAVVSASVWTRYAPQSQVDSVAKWIYSWWDDLGDAALAAAEKRVQASLSKEQQRRGAAGEFAGLLGQESDTRRQQGALQREQDVIEERLRTAGGEGRGGRQRVGLEKEAFDLEFQRKEVSKELLAINQEAVKAQAKTESQGRDILRDRIREAEILKDQHDALQRSLGLERQRLSLLEKQQQESRQVLEVSKNLAAQWVDANRQALEAQKTRIQAAKEEYGTANAQDRQAIAEIAKQIKAEGVGSLSGRQLEFAKSRQSIFGQYLGEQGTKRAGALGFDEVARTLGLTTDRQRAALQQAQAIEVNVRRVFEAKVELDSRVMAQETARLLGPIIRDLQINIARQTEVQAQQRESDRGFAERQRTAQRRADEAAGK